MTQLRVLVRPLLVASVVAILGLTFINASASPGTGNNTTQRQDQEPEWRRYLSSGSRACADGRYKEAEKSYSKALKCAKKLGKNTAEVAECLREMADLYLTLEKHDKAIEKREAALEIEELWVYGPRSAEVAASLCFIADALIRENIPSATTEEIAFYRDNQSWGEAIRASERPLRLLDRALTIQGKTLEARPLDYSKTLMLKAALELERMNNFAIALARGSARGGQQVYLHLGDVSVPYQEVESAYLEQCEGLEARCDTALGIQKAHLPPSHAVLARTQSIQAKLHKEIRFLEKQK